MVHLREDSPLDSAKVMELCNGKRSPYRLSPEMKLSRRYEVGEGIDHAEAMLAELEPLVTG